MLVLLRGELRMLTGDSEIILEDLETVSWPLVDVLTPAARELQGDVLRDLDHAVRAAQRYQQGLEAVEAQMQRLEGQNVRLHVRLGDALWSAGQSDAAFVQALRGRYAAEQFQGIMFQRRGAFEPAMRHYEIALALATEA